MITGLRYKCTYNKITSYCIPSLIIFILFSGNFFLESVSGSQTVASLSILSPVITSITAANPAANGFVQGATITIQFSEPTNQPFSTSTGNNLSTANINSLFSFINVHSNPISIGNTYTGSWITPSVFIIQIQDPGNVTASSLINNLEIRVNSGASLADAGGFVTSTSTSPPLTGNFGVPSAPFITGFIVDGSNAPQGTGFRSQDVFAIKFSQDTNMPGGTGILNNATTYSFFSFTPSLGNTTLSGQWMSPSLFSITVNSVDKAHPAVIGTTTVRPTLMANLKNVAGTSMVSDSTSPPLSGSFGTFTVSIPVLSGGTAVAMLPSGITSQITLPANATGIVTLTSTSAPTTGNAGSKLTFLGSPIDISLQTGICQALCTFSFQFTSDDLKNVNPPISDPTQVRIFHDQNGDGDFKDAGETLTTTVTTVSPGLFLATAKDSHTSKFGVGVVLAPASSPIPAPSPIGGGGSGAVGVGPGGGGSGSGVVGPLPKTTSSAIGELKIFTISYDLAKQKITVVTAKNPNAYVIIRSSIIGIVQAQLAKNQLYIDKSVYEAPISPNEKFFIVELEGIAKGEVSEVRQEVTITGPSGTISVTQQPTVSRPNVQPTTQLQPNAVGQSSQPPVIPEFSGAAPLVLVMAIVTILFVSRIIKLK